MECACFDADVDGYSTGLSDRIVKARREHRCGECRKTILPGEQYRREVVVDDRTFRTNKTCLDCNSAREVLCCSFFYGQVWELIYESIQDDWSIPWSKLPQLTPAAKERILKIIEERWEEEDEEVKRIAEAFRW